MSKDKIIEIAKEGNYIDQVSPELGYRCFADLDGTYAANFLRGFGFNIVFNVDAGTNGHAITSEGIVLSTNGYIHFEK